jgi:hypothetical protein
MSESEERRFLAGFDLQYSIENMDILQPILKETCITMFLTLLTPVEVFWYT